MAESAVPSADGASPTLKSIQMLRAIAAIGVLVHHTLHEISFYTSGGGVAHPVVLGGAGVDLFFVISGFVMVYSAEPLFARPLAPLYFMSRRLARIVPLYWGLSAFALAGMLLLRGGALPSNLTHGSVVASFLFVPYPGPNGDLIPPVHGLGWTLNYEMFFYVIFSFAVMLPRRCAVMAVIALFGLLTLFGSAVTLPQPFAFWCDPLILEFCFGMLIALAYRTSIRLPLPISVALVAAAIVGFALTVWVGLFGRFLVWGVPAAAMVAACVLSERSSKSSMIGRIFLFLGDISYSLYLVHALVIVAARKVIAPWFAPMPWAYAPVLIIGSLIASALTYLFFEKPVTRLLQRHIRNRWGSPSALRRRMEMTT